MKKSIISSLPCKVKNHKLFIIIAFCLIATFLLFSCNSPQDNYTVHYSNNEQFKFDLYANDLFVNELSSDALSLHFYLSNPKDFGIDNVPLSLGTYSYKNMADSQQYYIDQLNYLESLEYKKLLPNQQLTYDVLQNYFKSGLDFGDLCLCSEVLSPTTGIQSQFPVLFSEYSFANSKDIDNYLTLLSTLKDYYSQICKFQTYKAQNNCFISSFCCKNIISQCKDFIGDKKSSENLLHTSFLNRLNDCKFLSENQKQKYISKNLSVLEKVVFPAYEEIINTLEKLLKDGHCKNENGLFYLKNGKDYYQYLATLYTGSSKSVMELKSAIQNALSKDVRKLYSLLDINPELEKQLNSLGSENLNPKDILSDLQKKASKDFPELSNAKYQVKYVDKSLENYLSPAFYLTPPIDDLNKNTIYINNNKNNTENLYTTLAHEGIPGHMLQADFFASTSPLPIRHVINYGGYSEGWATYAELMSYQYEYDNRQLADVLACNSSYSLALYSLCDIGVNYEGWTLKDLTNFLKNYNIKDKKVCTSIFQTVVEEPANYLKYYGGYLEILEIKDSLKKELGDKFNLRKFHAAFLSIGPADFDTVRKWLPVKYNEY